MDRLIDGCAGAFRALMHRWIRYVDGQSSRILRRADRSLDTWTGRLIEEILTEKEMDI